MSPQLTLQTPLQIPPSEIPSYLNQLWDQDPQGNKGANTFCLIVWQPAWIEQELVRTGNIEGPVTGNQRDELIQAARKVILQQDLSHCTNPLDERVRSSLSLLETRNNSTDLRGQHVDAAISTLNPRRLITLAPTLQKDHPLETLVAAYCPLPEEGGDSSACGDVVVLRGDSNSLEKGLDILDQVLPNELPAWLWWNGNLDEAPELLRELAVQNRRLIIDTALGDPLQCLHFSHERINSGQAINDLNWLRLRTWRETLAMVFDPPDRRDSLKNVIKLDIDIEGNHPVQGLLLAAWISERLGWKLQCSNLSEGNIICAKFKSSIAGLITLRIMPLPIGNPSIHPGQIVGLRMICNNQNSTNSDLCVILASESGECRRLEAGGMASKELLEEVVPIQSSSVEMDVARLLSSSRGTTSPLLLSAIPIATEMLKMIKSSE